MLWIMSCLFPSLWFSLFIILVLVSSVQGHFFWAGSHLNCSHCSKTSGANCSEEATVLLIRAVVAVFPKCHHKHCNTCTSSENRWERASDLALEISLWQLRQREGRCIMSTSMDASKEKNSNSSLLFGNKLQD